MSTNFFCKIYVFTTSSRQEVITFLSEYYNVENLGNELTLPNCELSILKNPDSDVINSTHYPDGFLYFPFVLELEFGDVDNNIAVTVISKLLLYLWQMKISAVASCDYEYDLPNNGGYKSDKIPWPK